MLSYATIRNMKLPKSAFDYLFIEFCILIILVLIVLFKDGI